MATDAPDRPGHARRLALNTPFFSFATGLSRVLGLAREVVVASYFGVTGAMSAFTIAFQVPNLVRALFADSALQGAFVPVFTELLEKGERREASRAPVTAASTCSGEATGTSATVSSVAGFSMTSGAPSPVTCSPRMRRRVST